MTRAGRALREISKQGREYGEVWGTFNSDGAEEMYKRIQRNKIRKVDWGQISTGHESQA